MVFRFDALARSRESPRPSAVRAVCEKNRPKRTTSWLLRLFFTHLSRGLSRFRCVKGSHCGVLVPSYACFLHAYPSETEVVQALPSGSSRTRRGRRLHVSATSRIDLPRLCRRCLLPKIRCGRRRIWRAVHSAYARPLCRSLAPIVHTRWGPDSTSVGCVGTTFARVCGRVLQNAST